MKEVFRIYRVVQDHSTGAGPATYKLEAVYSVDGVVLPEFEDYEQARKAVADLIANKQQGPFTIIEEFSM